jgi:hypothetical protein
VIEKRTVGSKADFELSEYSALSVAVDADGLASVDVPAKNLLLRGCWQNSPESVKVG